MTDGRYAKPTARAWRDATLDCEGGNEEPYQALPYMDTRLAFKLSRARVVRDTVISKEHCEAIRALVRARSAEHRRCCISTVIMPLGSKSMSPLVKAALGEANDLVQAFTRPSDDAAIEKTELSGPAPGLGNGSVVAPGSAPVLTTARTRSLADLRT